MFRSTNTLQPGQLFGVSIESVVEQENSGFLVPLLVKRCTQEIEKRGLDIIGLYRLCGSETKKKMLREAFEADPEAVDLSSENVPDINVITSMLNSNLFGLVVANTFALISLTTNNKVYQNKPEGLKSRKKTRSQ